VWPTGQSESLAFWVVLTYMSMHDELRDRIEEGRLRVLAPKRPTIAGPRIILLNSETADLIEGPWGDADSEVRMQKLRADLDLFSRGGLIVVATRKHKTCLLKRLEPLDQEVWEFRSRDPKPGTRLFGRFAKPDTFVGTNIAARIDLKSEGSREWRDEIERCKSEWRKLFGTYPAFSGDKLDVYITSGAIDEQDL
jgi:hypothetical protein